MFKRIFSVIITAAMLSNLSAFAQLSEVDGVYSEDFEGYEAGADVIADKTIIKEFTKFEPELLENDGSQAMVVNSASGADNMIFTNANLYNNELNIIKFKMGADSSAKLNWGSTSSLVFSHTNDAGIMVNDYIFDFAYSLVRHKENGVTEKAICGFASKKMYNIEIRAVKQLRNEKYYYDVTYVVDGAENMISFPTTEDGTMRIGFKSTSGNKVYIDDIEVYGYTLVKTEVNIAERNDVSVKPAIEVFFSDAIDESSLIPGDIRVGEIPAKEIELIDENKYLITLSEPLKKNTEYTLDISAIRDMKGNSLEKSKFAFKTKNTAVVLDGSDVVNTSEEEAENILIILPGYDENGTMISKSVLNFEIYPEEEISMGNEECLVLTDDYRPIASTVYASNTGKTNDEFSAEFDSAAQKVRISGKTASGIADEMIAISVTNGSGEVDYTSVIKTGENGYFSMEYTPVSVSGVYNAAAKTMQEKFTSPVNIRLSSDIETLLEIINSKDVVAITVALETYKEVLLIDLDLYAALEDKSFICEELAKSDKYETIEKLIDDIKVLSLIDTMKSAEDMYQVFTGYESLVLSEDDSAYTVWKELSDADKKSVLEAVISDKVYAPDEFKEEIYVVSILKMIEGTNKYIDVKNAIEAYPDLLGIGLDDYNKAGKPSSVAKGLCGKKWDIDSFGKKFDELVDDAKDTSSDKKGSSGGGGGGGGGAVLSGNVASVKATPEPMNTPVPTAEPTMNPTAEPISFNDMDEAQWAESAVYSLCERGILKGYEDGSFRPNGNITREEFVAVIVRYLGFDTPAKCSFDDVSENDWFYEAVAKAYSKGIIKGISETQFGTGNIITRQDAALILYNIGGLDAEGDMNFNDAGEIAHYATEAVRVLSVNGIINGNPDGSFEPTGTLTRAQAAKLIYAYDMEKEDGR